MQHPDGNPAATLKLSAEEFEALQTGRPFVWFNTLRQGVVQALGGKTLSRDDMVEASRRWQDHAAVLAHLFPGEVAADGIVDSELVNLQVEDAEGGATYIKCDHNLPIGASIKARGGVFEVLEHAGDVAAENGLRMDPASPDWPKLLALLSEQRVVVGSTGNLAYSVARMARALGFRAEVHISSDATPYKKQRLKDLGARVVEHPGDYRSAVAAARESASNDPLAYFVDDESSSRLFLGYSHGGKHLSHQLADRGIAVSAERPLVVYLPCGVGGAPGGLTLGLKSLFGDHCHCVLVEPTQSPCATIQLMAGLEQSISVYDIGLTNETLADGLAVPAASMFAMEQIAGLVTACVTVAEDEMLRRTAMLNTQGHAVEPSAASAVAAIAPFLAACRASADPQLHRLAQPCATHVAWSTGHSTPDTAALLARGKTAEPSRAGASK